MRQATDEARRAGHGRRRRRGELWRPPLPAGAVALGQRARQHRRHAVGHHASGLGVRPPHGLCWAELGNSYPIAGGDYALVWHSFKGRSSPLAGPLSFVTFALYVDFMAFIPATIALSAGTYFGVVANVDPRYVGAVILVIAAALATREIRFNTVVTSIFLGIELAALLVLTVLGLSHARHWGSLIRPVIAGGHGRSPVPFSVTAAAAAIAIFSFAGYQSSVTYSEETGNPRRNVARAVLWAPLLIVVTLITLGIGLVYWAIVILPQRGRAWNLREAAVDETEAAAVEDAPSAHG